MKDAEQWKVQNGASRRLKLVQHCIYLTIAKNENISKTAVTFLVFDSSLLTAAVLHKSYKILFLYVFHKSTFQTVLQLSGFSIWSQSKF